MLVKALVSFAGKISMYAGETREVEDNEIVKDLMRAGYIEEIEAKAEKAPKIVEPEAVELQAEEPEAQTKKSSRKSKSKKK